MLQVTDYVMRFAPVAVFAAVTATVAERGPSILGTYGYFMGSFYIGLVLLWLLLIGVCFLIVGGADAPSGALHPRSDRARLLDRLVGGRLPAHAGGARPVRRAAADRQLRPAAGLFVQPRRLDDVHDLRVDLHRPGLWHRPYPRPGDRDAADADDHLEGHCRRAARQPGRHHRDAVACSTFPRPGSCSSSPSTISSTWAARRPTSSAMRWRSVVARWEGALDPLEPPTSSRRTRRRTSRRRPRRPTQPLVNWRSISAAAG